MFATRLFVRAGLLAALLAVAAGALLGVAIGYPAWHRKERQTRGGGLDEPSERSGGADPVEPPSPLETQSNVRLRDE